MSTSMILFLTLTLFGAFVAALTVWLQVRGGGKWRDVHWWVPAGMLAFGAAFGGLAFLLDSGIAEKTLFEAEVPGSGATTPAVLQWQIPVEHPGAPHELGVYLNSDDNVETPADVRVQLGDSLGRVLIDDERSLTPDCSGKSWDCTWDSYHAEFTPPVDGTMQLTVTLLTPDVPTVHVWMGDDDKTDGTRIPGY